MAKYGYDDQGDVGMRLALLSNASGLAGHYESMRSLRQTECETAAALSKLDDSEKT